MHCIDYLKAVDAVFTAQLKIEESKPAENCEIQRGPDERCNFYPLEPRKRGKLFRIVHWGGDGSEPQSMPDRNDETEQERGPWEYRRW